VTPNAGTRRGAAPGFLMPGLGGVAG